MLHWTRNDGALQKGHLVLVDAGVETDTLYAGDITRTYPVRGKYTNATGSVYTNWCLFKANDEDGSWIFSDPNVNQSATHVSIVGDPVWTDGYYYPPGPP